VGEFYDSGEKEDYKMCSSFLTKWARRSLFTILITLFLMLLAIQSGSWAVSLHVPLADCPTGTFPGTEAYASTLALQMSFIAGEIWMVGGAGSFYGNGKHCNALNDYYATDWNRGNDDGAVVLPVADGFVSDTACLTGQGYGCYVQIDHANGYRTLYAHLSVRLVNQGDPVHPWTLIGKVGNTGLPVGEGAHLHLTFRHFDTALTILIATTTVKLALTQKILYNPKAIAPAQ
jgi:hypothetical protein